MSEDVLLNGNIVTKIFSIPAVMRKL